MDEQDDFAVWVADGLLKAQDDEIAAASLSDLYAKSANPAEFDRQLDEASSQAKRPGDFGLEFIGPLLPVLFVEFGRLLWQAYSKELLSQGGKALAGATIDAVKALFKKKSASPEGLAEAEVHMRDVAQRAGLNNEQTEAVVAALRDPNLASTLVAR